MNELFIFQRFLWSKPLLNKETSTVLEAFDDIIKTLEQKPLYVCSDLGKEFTNKAFKLYCVNNGMKLIHPYTHEKAAFIERAHQTIQSIFWSNISDKGDYNIINILDDVIKTYNNRSHRMLGGRSPQWAEDNPDSSHIANHNKKYLDRVNKYKRRPRFKIGDKVRVKKSKDTFAKHYDTHFNDEYYQVIQLVKHFPINMYKIESLDRVGDDKIVKGLWYEYQLQKVDQDEHRINHVIRRRGDQVLVNWRGFPSKFDSWIPASSIRNLN